jgi:phenylacetate-CoA ligase
MSGFEATAARGHLGDGVTRLLHGFAEPMLRPGRRAALQSLLQTDFASPETLRGLQERLLRDLLARARASSPWYRDRLRDAPAPAVFRLEDLGRLPILDRSDLQEHLEEISGAGRLEPRVRVATSSGSSGTPVRLYHSREYRDWTAAAFDRGYLMCRRFRLGMRRAFFWGSEIESRAHRGPAGTVRDLVLNQLWFDAFALRRDGLSDAIRRLRAFRPALVVGYVSTLTEIARALDQPLEGLGGLVAAAETLTPPERALIQDSFGAPVFDRYATREVGTIAHECEEHAGLHIVAENNLLEVVGPDGMPSEDPLAEGEVLVTNLRNFATPLIRYRLGDLARLGRPGCACGRKGSRLETVVGRTSDLIVSPSGVILHGLFFMRAFDNTPVRRFRVDQETPARLRVRVVPAAGYTDKARERVTALILGRDAGFEVVWEVVDDIPLTASGKFRFTASQVRRS